MAEYEKKVREILLQNGCTFKRRGKGDHDVWYSPIVNKAFPVDGKIVSRHTANAIMKQAGIKYHF
jgi:predicted RNA binding protein YcfA (HicA-like mRNA interferase family)